MTYDDRVELWHGDCVDAMAVMPANSVDAVVTDPPYGLEFMGREWDRLDIGLPQQSVWRGRRGQGGSSITDDDRYPASRHAVTFGAKRAAFRRCTTCGRRAFSGSPCECDDPQWVIEHPQGAPSSAVRMQRWHERWAREALRVLKPGGHLLAFGGTRTYHRLVCAVEDAGFDIRDTITWLYGQGFPKSLDVGKAIDDAAGAEREVVATQRRRDINGPGRDRGFGVQAAQRADGPTYIEHQVTAPATDEAAAWDGWGTALKPASEPIVVARKPLAETVAGNVVEWGTGALNIDGCRIDGAPPSVPQPNITRGRAGFGASDGRSGEMSEAAGRWPANVVLGHSPQCEVCECGARGPHDPTDDCRIAFACVSGCAVAALDRQTGITVGAEPRQASYERSTDGTKYSGDTGGASRFFYCAKASTADRGAGNDHPTVKPVELMRWLVRLVTPADGVVLDPFAGSGTTGVAAEIEGRRCVLVEREPAYQDLVHERLDRPLQTSLLGALT